MQPHSLWPAVVVALLLPLCSAYATTGVPTHCKSGEFSIVNAWMGEAIPTDRGWENSHRGKFVSLCADKTKEPFGYVVYRYGSVGHIDLEVKATKESPFGIFYRPSDQTDQVVYFTRNGYTYDISIATGMGSGIFLNVYKSEKLVSSHFSGNIVGSDYTLGPAGIDFYGPKAKSLTLVYDPPPFGL